MFFYFRLFFSYSRYNQVTNKHREKRKKLRCICLLPYWMELNKSICRSYDKKEEKYLINKNELKLSLSYLSIN